MTSCCVWSATNAAAGGGLEVDAVADGRSNTGEAATVYSGTKWDTNGIEYEVTTYGGFTNVNTYMVSGSSSDVWVEFTRTGGTESSFIGKSNSTRYNINVDQTFEISAPAIETNTIIGYFTFYDAATGGNTLDTTSGATWSARQRNPI